MVSTREAGTKPSALPGITSQVVQHGRFDPVSECEPRAGTSEDSQKKTRLSLARKRAVVLSSRHLRPLAAHGGGAPGSLRGRWTNTCQNVGDDGVFSSRDLPALRLPISVLSFFERGGYSKAVKRDA